MNNIQNYGIGFKGGKKTAIKELLYTKQLFAEGVAEAQSVIKHGAKRVKPDHYVLDTEGGVVKIRNFEQYLPQNIKKIPLTCSDGSEASAIAVAFDNAIRDLEKHVEKNPNDIEARAQLSKIKEALKIDY